jgi:hypothetical protein
MIYPKSNSKNSDRPRKQIEGWVDVSPSLDEIERCWLPRTAQWELESPTLAQLDYLYGLGWDGPVESRAEASRIIDAYKS